MSLPEDDNPFGGIEPELKERIQERMPQPIRPRQAMQATAGLLLMTLGGLGLVAGVVLGPWLMNTLGDPNSLIANAVFWGVIGLACGVCSLGYYFWQQGQKRKRQPPN